jgi:methyl-accepting chemotaxis protein
MSFLIEALNDPTRFITVLMFILLTIVLNWFRKRMSVEFEEMKEVVRNSAGKIESQCQQTREGLLKHSLYMQDLSEQISKLRGTLYKDIQGLVHKSELIAMEIDKVERSFKATSQDFDSQVKFISSIRTDLEKMYGDIKRVDENAEGLKITVVNHKNTLKNIHQVLLSHNESIKKMKG